MPESNNIDYRSEEVQEILGTPPNWMVRWGTTLALVTVVLLAWIAYWVRYPDVVPEKIKITSLEPPRRLVADNGVTIAQILVESEDTVSSGQTLMVFKNKAKMEDVHTLQDRLDGLKNISDSALLNFDPGRDLLLGELQDDVYNFMEKQQQLLLAVSPKYQKLGVRQLQKELGNMRSRIDYDRERKEKLASQLDLVNQRLRQEEILFKDNALPFPTLRRTREEVLALEREMQSIESTTKANQFEVESIRAQISGMRESSYNSQINASAELKEAFTTLKNQLEEWKKKYLIVSPIEGIAIIPNENITEQQFVLATTELMVIIPLKKTETIGKINLNVNGSGKVQVGQRVIVKLESYPFHEFGALIGKVSWKGRIASGGTIPVEVRFPQGLITTTGRQIDPSREMTGSAEIITENKRFIERIFEQVRTMPY